MSILSNLISGKVSLTAALAQSVNWARNLVGGLPVVGPAAAGAVIAAAHEGEKVAATGLNAAADTIEGVKAVGETVAHAYLTAHLGPIGENLVAGVVDGFVNQLANTVEAALHGAAAALTASAGGASAAPTAVPPTHG